MNKSNLPGKTVGIICEYNPFHNGHKYQLEMSRKLTGAEHVVCIMSGSFMQRGEPAAWDKWLRAEMALRNGADLVIELPVVYSCQAAEYFATGAVKILNEMKIIDYLCFGSESGDLTLLKMIAEVLAHEPPDVGLLIRRHLDEGMVYPKAYQTAILEHLTSTHPEQLKEIRSILESPNNILGLEYLKAIFLTSSNMEAVTVKRMGSGYNEVEISSTLASATGIRSEMRRSGLSETASSALPDASRELLSEQTSLLDWEAFRDLLFYKLRSSDLEELRDHAYISEGIENRILKYLPQSESVNELIDHVKTKRFTRTSIQRMLLAILLGIRKKDLALFKESTTPSYIRVLALNEKGGKLIRRMKKLEVENIITKFASFVPSDERLIRMQQLDIRATEIYHSALEQRISSKKPEKKGLRDYLTSPIILP